MVDVNTTVFNKQLEELESLADATGLYEDQQDDDEEEVAAEPSMEWRRALIEESYTRVKRAKSRPVDPNRTYEIGTLLFEPAEGKFGRVKRSVPGYLCIAFIRGGEREYGRRPDVESYLRDHHRGKTAAELAVQLGLTESEVQGHLNRLGLVRHDAIPQLDGSTDVAASERADRADKARATRAARKDLIPGVSEEDTRTDDRKLRTKAPEELPPLPASKGKPEHKTPALGSKLPAPSATKSVAPKAATKPPPVAAKGKTAPPPPATKAKSTPPPVEKGRPAGAKPGVMAAEDANAYIRKHFQAMSNKILAEKTGLSEHTIRRKLGEWKLRRERD